MKASKQKKQPAKKRVAERKAPRQRRGEREREEGRRAPRKKKTIPPEPMVLDSPRNNETVADALDEIADLLDIQEENPFRIRAYRTASMRVRELPESLSDRIARGEDLLALPGIGADLAQKLVDLTATGTTAALEELRAEVPASLRELLHISALGPKRVHLLHKELGIESVDELRHACESGVVRTLRGFGEKSEQNILEALNTYVERSQRYRRDVATRYADEALRALESVPGVGHVVVGGSFRRAKETVGDLDLLVTAEDPGAVTARFLSLPEVDVVASSGPTRSTVHLRNGMQLDMRVVAEESYGAALHYFTGSKAHNIAVRAMGQARGLKINEYGVFRGDRRVAGDTEESVFDSVGLPWIPPELREHAGEIEAAREGRLPELVRLEDLRGDLHAHTVASDGQATAAQMAHAAKAQGLEYLAITDHSKRLRMVRGINEKKLPGYIEELRAADAEVDGVTILAGLEVDILEDGSLDLSDDLLLELDVVVISVHSGFRMPRDKQTERLLRALDHRSVSILGHPSTRLIGERAPIDVDMERVVRHAKQRGCFLELDSQPSRLDLTDVHCRLAKEEGVLVSVASDAHSPLGFENLRYGIGQARRGWLEKDDVLNTRTLRELRALLARARA